MTPEEFAVAKEAAQHKRKPHPHRSKLYGLVAILYLISLPDNTAADSDLDLGMIQLVQTISSVSPGFRKELADVFWFQIGLDVLDYCIVHLENFILGRPAALKGNKSLTIISPCDYSDTPLFRNLSDVIDLLASS